MKLKEIEVVVDAQPVPCLLISVNQPFAVIFANKAFIKGIAVTEMATGSTNYADVVSSYFDRGSQKSLLKAVKEVQHSRQSQPDKLVVNTGTSNKPLDVDTYPMFNGNNELVCLAQNFSTHICNVENNWQESFELFNYSPLPTLAYDTASLRILAANKAAENTFGYTIDEYLTLNLKDMWYVPDAVALQYSIDTKARKGLCNKELIRLVTKDGRVLSTEITSTPLPAWGPNTRLMMAHDVTEQVRSAHNAKLLRSLEQLERHILELNSQPNTPMEEVLNNYTRGIEAMFPEMTCSVMQIKNNKLYNWTTSSLPKNYTDAIEALPIGNNVGSCGTSAYLKQPVIVSDIATDFRWANYYEIALGNNLLACWSYPILNSKNEVVATFGLYYNKVRSPEEYELKIIDRAAALLKVIIENRQYASDLKEAMQLMSQGQELAQFGNWAWDIVENKLSWSDTLYKIYGHTRSELVSTFDNYQELLHPDDRARVCGIIKGVLASGKDVSFEERIIRPDGELRYLRSWATLKYDSNGAPLKMIGASLDVTESKRIQRDMEALKNRYSDLFQLSPHPMFVYDVNTLKYLDANNAATEIYGYSKEEFLNMKLPDIRPVEDLPAFERVMRDEIQAGLPHTGISRHVKKNGDIINVMTRGNSINYDGRSARIVIAIDYTDKFNAEDALRRSESRFKALIQEGSDLICITDDNGKYKYVSPNSIIVTGVDADELTGRNIADYMTPEDASFLKQEIAKLNEQQRVELKPLLFKNANGRERWLQTVLTDLRTDPAINGIVFNSRDVTQRVQQDNTIKEHLERYNIVSKATSDAIWDYNIVEGTITWNQGINAIFGHHNLNTTYQWWFTHVHPDDIDDVITIVNLCILKKHSRWQSEYRFLCADGSYKSVLDRGFLIFDDNDRPVRMIGAMQDVTERMNYIHDIEKHNTRLQEISWTQSHLVRAPLARMLGLLDLLNKGQFDTDTKMMLEYLNISARELDDIVQNIIVKSQPYTIDVPSY
ncbi:PAS domain S-box protein [Mucilaginibacter sp. JRF]|uniref:PAS domain S-box protein n=1 Tax=Mucilaginibacter sp. JRF TaxID=2780088 RepID=UPI00188125D1|nr:PAS domain S-box protein [Mucilaginibacter sp. JRF]MBE9582993.1 PAS domain S-box protein [Mucilaginibacter sp. JRF]